MAARSKKVKKKQYVNKNNFSIDGVQTNKQQNTSLSIDKTIKPITATQERAFDMWTQNSNIMLHGVAGTGKTFLALYFALRDVFDLNKSYHKVYIVRSVVPTRDMGHLPGSQSEKEQVYETPYIPVCNDIFGRDDAYSILKQKRIVEFKSTSFLRGSTFDNAIIVVDEAQNMSDAELHTVMTRVGRNCKIIIAGDTRQDDLTSKRYKEESGLTSFMKILSRMKEFGSIEFQIEDIVRSTLVKSYIISRYELGM